MYCVVCVHKLYTFLKFVDIYYMYMYIIFLLTKPQNIIYIFTELTSDIKDLSKR